MRHFYSHLHSPHPFFLQYETNQDKLSYYAGVISSRNANIRALTMLAALKADVETTLYYKVIISLFVSVFLRPLAWPVKLS